MALKMRFLYYSSKTKMKNIAEAVKVEFDLAQNFNAIDIIPPAYSCANERLVILAISGKGDPDDILRRFCSELDKKKSQNVALLVDGDQRIANKIIDVLKETGTNFIDNVKFVKLGGLPFIGGSLKDDEKADILSWVHDVVNSIQ